MSHCTFVYSKVCACVSACGCVCVFMGGSVEAFPVLGSDATVPNAEHGCAQGWLIWPIKRMVPGDRDRDNSSSSSSSSW